MGGCLGLNSIADLQDVLAGCEASLCLLAELQENNARKELTGAERKAFAAEVGRICLKLRENSNSYQNSNLENQWILELAKNSGISQPTAYNWWSAFTKESGLELTPKQAGEVEKGLFFAWLDAQKAKDEAEKERRIAEQEADKQRKADEARALAGMLETINERLSELNAATNSVPTND